MHDYEDIMKQTFFNYNFKPNLEVDNYFVGNSNNNAFNTLIKFKNFHKKFFLIGPHKSGKTHLSMIWKAKYQAIQYKDNFDQLIEEKKNILIDDIFY